MTSKIQLPPHCLVCYQEFLQEFQFKKHVDSVHENEDSHNCSICDKSFSHKCNLKIMLKKFMRLDQPDKRAKAQVENN